MTERTMLVSLSRHGTGYGYDKGCRCKACSQAKFAKRRAARARARAEGRASYFRELAQSRANKERYRGTCRKCGAATTGGDGPAKAPELCNHCAPAENAHKWRGRGPMQARLRVVLATGPLHFVEIQCALGITKGYAGVLLNASLRNGIVERPSRGVYRLTDQP